MKAVVYAGTRNVYQDMIPSMKSLLIHSDVDKIYFLIEDDEFPYELPPEVECINVSKQQWFNADTCPNMKNRCSYMVLLRAAFTKIFPHLDKILNIDNDTVVKNNISELWDIDLTDYYLAGCGEPKQSKNNFTYINMGVAMINLKKLREDGKDEEMIEKLNTYYYPEAEQTCFNRVCQGHILLLPNCYNATQYTIKEKNTTQTKIQHYACNPKWPTLPIMQKYRDIEIVRNISDSYDVDLIIPHYNNINGLETTLKSADFKEYSNFHITVVDDCSTNCDISVLKEKYPTVNFISTDINGGPGAARQKGIDSTISPYFMFIDAGDRIKNKIAIGIILQTIAQHNDAYIYSFSWYNHATKGHYCGDEWSLYGSVFKREFIELYDIHFITDPDHSYCGEDLSFMQSSYLQLQQIAKDEIMNHYYKFPVDIIEYLPDAESIMHTNPHKKIIKGIAYNMDAVAQFGRKNNIYPLFIAKRVAKFMVQLYIDYLKCARKAPELLDYNWEILKYYYKNVYRTYEVVGDHYLQEIYNQWMPTIIKLTSEVVPRVNINRFLGELKND